MLTYPLLLRLLELHGAVDERGKPIVRVVDGLEPPQRRFVGGLVWVAAQAETPPRSGDLLSPCEFCLVKRSRNPKPFLVRLYE